MPKMQTSGGIDSFNNRLKIHSKKINNIINIFNKYGKIGVDALKANTPVDTGKTANSWSYKITRKGNNITLSFLNSNRQNGVAIAAVIYYGHMAKTGHWIEGRDYIKPAIDPVFKELFNEIQRGGEL